MSADSDWLEDDFIVTVTIGPDDQPEGPAWSYVVCVDGDYGTNDAGDGRGPRSDRYGYVRTDDWFSFLRRRCNLPGPVKRAGLHWSDASVAPYGWSLGAGHAPQGIHVEWRLP